MANKAVIPFLVAMMLLTGVCNTLLSKYQVRPVTGVSYSKTDPTQDLQCVRNCDSPNEKDKQRFSQPVLQTYAHLPLRVSCD